MMLVEWAVLVAICAAVAGIAVFWLTPRRANTGLRSEVLGAGPVNDTVWLFAGNDLIDASSRAKSLIADANGSKPWDKFHETFIARFPDLPDTIDDVQDQLRFVASAADAKDPDVMTCEWINGVTRVQLCNRALPEQSPSDKSEADAAASHEAEAMRLMINEAPYPVWRVSPSGAVTWHNTAYEKLSAKMHGTPTIDDTPLFPSVPKTPTPGRKTRDSLMVEGQSQKMWFDVSIIEHETGNLCYAVDINAVVDAENAQRNFVQTLAKTFAQLSIGLAIFDRNRQLALFNPALIDLTALPADFLSARPNILSFFDRLRDQRMMPEPKNYNSWRHQMADLVKAAADGRYQETWSLPSGSVYSVKGRPHPDGAVAFLIEDITAEITLTRRFRSDLELGQAILDQLEDAIAVFAADGSLNFSNKAYRKLWSVDPDNSFAQVSILDATRTWQDQCKASPVLGEIRDFVATRENRAEWWAPLSLKSGLALICNVYPIQSGATMVSFNRSDIDKPVSAPAKVQETVES